MPTPLSKGYTAFAGHRLLAAGGLGAVAIAVKTATEQGPSDPILVFDDATGRVIDLDLRGTDAEIHARVSQPSGTFHGHDRPSVGAAFEPSAEELSEPRGPGRPKLGVVAREVTLLPRHWEWLTDQPGGASAALRRLVDQARREGGTREHRRTAQEAAYQFMHAIAGDFPDYEEATRALFADDRTSFEQRIADWPADIRTYVVRLAFGTRAPASQE